MDDSSKSREIEKKDNFKSLPNGQSRFAKGNKIGQMKKKGYTIKDLTDTALAYDKSHDVTILQHYIGQLIKDNKLLKDFVNKYVPTTNKSEVSGPGGEPLSFVIEKTYQGENDKQQDTSEVNP